MARKKGAKDDFEEQLEEYLKEPGFAKSFEQETNKLRIAVKIAECRERKGMTQKDLAEKLNTTQSVVSRLENASYENYSIRTLRKIADALQCELVIDLK